MSCDDFVFFCNDCPLLARSVPVSGASFFFFFSHAAPLWPLSSGLFSFRACRKAWIGLANLHSSVFDKGCGPTVAIDV